MFHLRAAFALYSHVSFPHDRPTGHAGSLRAAGGRARLRSFNFSDGNTLVRSPSEKTQSVSVVRLCSAARAGRQEQHRTAKRYPQRQLPNQHLMESTTQVSQPPIRPSSPHQASKPPEDQELDVALNGQEPTVKNLILAAIGVMKVTASSLNSQLSTLRNPSFAESQGQT